MRAIARRPARIGTPFVLSKGMNRSIKHPRAAREKSTTSPGASALAVGLSADQVPQRTPAQIQLSLAATGCEAIELLKVLRFDLLLVANGLPDMSVWSFAETVRHHWPWQRWAMLAPGASTTEVRLAGERGAVGVFDELSTLLAAYAPRGRPHPPPWHPDALSARRPP